MWWRNIYKLNQDGRNYKHTEIKSSYGFTQYLFVQLFNICFGIRFYKNINIIITDKFSSFVFFWIICLLIQALLSVGKCFCLSNKNYKWELKFGASFEISFVWNLFKDSKINYTWTQYEKKNPYSCEKRNYFQISEVSTPE